MILYPFVSVILWSLILTLAMHPLHSKLSAKMGGKPKLASFIIVFTVLLILIIPSWFLIASLANEIKELKLSYLNGTLAIPHPDESVKGWPVIGEKIYELWLNITVNMDQMVVKYKDQILDIGIKVGKGILSTTGALMTFLISFIIASVLLVVEGLGESIRKFFRKTAGKRGDELADLTLITVGSVVKGVLGEGFVLALLHGIVFALAGVPYAGIWTLAVFILCVVQMPVYLITVPVIVYFFGAKELAPAIIWSVVLLLTSLSDNILTPLMLGKRAPVPMLVIFIGVIGGFMLSGIIGLFTGAIVMSVGYKLFVGWINSNDAEIQEN
jgi:predicted PurR-regulated permease PerM